MILITSPSLLCHRSMKWTTNTISSVYLSGRNPGFLILIIYWTTHNIEGLYQCFPTLFFFGPCTTKILMPPPQAQHNSQSNSEKYNIHVDIFYSHHPPHNIHILHPPHFEAYAPLGKHCLMQRKLPNPFKKSVCPVNVERCMRRKARH